MLLQEKVALITGAASGLGRAQAIEYAKEGAKVILSDVNAEGLAETEKLIKDNNGTVLSIVADVSKKEDVHSMINKALEEFGTVDICVNNAAILADFKASLDITEEEWDKIMAVNVKGVYLLTNEILPHMLEKGKGTFINVASIGGTIAGVGDAAYITSKHAVVGYTKQLTFNYAKDGIRAVALCPGLIDTPMVQYAIEQDRPEVVRQIESIPSKHIGRSEEVAYFSVYLASDKAKHINGVEMKIDGGQSIS
ncbi:SDR family NAD(P)-dependent oxidoreductase [Lederbergia citrea]|uniref:Glucose 1-dehydrogenase n=1 Tax=Lederbergia citrea TaxID=2833581 RepID=A0A942UM01_9BACI|nr:glucose 1-dehydrogenase [Lederbergia citrea]MBS4204327.1 glucose 1-dehydrogenase [Lederbergia citrea]MBS4223825.1 glucose 1-dehydrogenase [Lederbergia citrea]